MHIIVVGAGEVGSYVADLLSREGHDVAVVEKDPARLRRIDETLDVLTVAGSGTSRRCLERAGLDRADLLVAVTSVDEVNLLSSLVAKQHGVARTVVRTESSELRDASADLLEAVGADLVIDPDSETAEEILELLEFPGLSEVATMAAGQVAVIGARLGAEAPVVGRTLVDIAQEHEPDWHFLFGVLDRDGDTIIPRGDQRLEAGDQVRVVCTRSSRSELFSLLGITHHTPREVMVLGGGRTAEVLAGRLLHRGARVTIVERDHARAEELAELLPRALILEGEITDTELLLDASVGRQDAVVALTGEDDANVLACHFAKNAGTRETVAVVHRLALLPLLAEARIDVALSPRTATANAVLRFVRGGIAAVATTLQGDAEILELEVGEASPAAGAVVAELHLPDDVLIGAVVRDGEAQIARGRTTLAAGDRVIVFAMRGALEAARRPFG